MENLPKVIGVVGSGSFATAIVKMLTQNQAVTPWCVRNEYVKGYIQNHRHNPNYLTSVEFNTEKLKLTSNINELLNQCDTVIFVTPSIYLKDALKKVKGSLTNHFVVSAIKGIVPDFNDIVGNYFHQEWKIPFDRIGVITGPCHAEEIALERLSYLTIASENEELAGRVARALKSHFIRTKISDDIFGTEYGAVLKNIFAIAAGLAHGLGYGDNFQAVLMSNSIREMQRFLKKVHPIKRSINHSAYLGDLLVTGYSFFSRNRMLGNMIGKGYTVRSALLEMNMVPEGYYAVEAIYNISKEKKIGMPIVKAVYKILIEKKNPVKVFAKLTEKLD